MELHRHWKPWLYGPLWLAGGVLMLLAPEVIYPAIDHEFWAGNWVMYPMGAVAVIVGSLGVDSVRRPFVLRFDGTGVEWRINGRGAAVPWRAVVRLAVERTPDDPPRAKPRTLMLWLREPVPSAGRPDVTFDGLVGYELTDVRDLAESADTVTAVLRRYVPASLPDGAHERRVAVSPALDGPVAGGGSALDGLVLRPPADGECAICGCTPATVARAPSIANLTLFHSITVRRGSWCRDCALATYRELTDRTLFWCWWGVGVVATPFVLAIARRQMRAALRLDPPRPTPGVSAPSARPLDPGRPVMARASGRFALAMLGLMTVGILLVFLL